MLLGSLPTIIFILLFQASGYYLSAGKLQFYNLFSTCALLLNGVAAVCASYSIQREIDENPEIMMPKREYVKFDYHNYREEEDA